jgi:S-adenosylmethionine hydrolase
MSQVAILTDFGISDNYNGVMEAVIRKINPNVSITYITPNASNFNVISGAYLLFTSYKYFRKNTIFLTVIDPGVGTTRKAIIIKTKNYYFVGPDNGVLFPAAFNDSILNIIEITNEKLFLSKEISRTFHGRDIFAASAAFLSLGIDLEIFGNKLDINKIEKIEFNYIKENNFICGNIIYIDHFGNVATSIREQPTNLKNILINSNKFNVKNVNTFGEGKKGELLAYKNGYGFLEIGINMGNASELTGAKIGDKICLELFTQGDFSHSI